MSYLVEQNSLIVVFMALSFIAGIVVCYLTMVPGIVCLQSQLRALNDALRISRNNAAGLFTHVEHLEDEIKELLSFVSSRLPEGGE